MSHWRTKLRNSVISTTLSTLVILSTMVVPISAFAQTTIPQTKQAAASSQLENYAEYLAANYGIHFDGNVSVKEFGDALGKALKVDKAAFDESSKGISTFSALNAVSLAVKAADLKELAYTYPQQKVFTALDKAKISHGKDSPLTAAAVQELAVAIDTELVPPSYYSILAANGPVTADFASVLLGKAISFKGAYKNYLGYVMDDDIFGKLNHAWSSSNLIDAADLRIVVDEGLKQNLVTGYNLKDARYNPNFDPKLSITYGHSDIAHAIQLIGLLRSEGIQAKVQFEPKTSAFIYLKEWGEPTQTPDYKVVQIENGNYIAYAKEYDISFEFTKETDKQAFDGLISKYAKKNEENQKGLLIGSWWQPLYFSSTELKGYQVITNNLITKGNYIAQSFSLNEKSAAVIDGFKKLDPTINISSYKFWVDQPFFNYLLGDYK